MPQPPHCVGLFEPGDTVCNGDPNGQTDADKAVCAWRNRCAGLKAYCAQNKQHPSLIVAASTYSKLVELCEGQVAKLGIVDGLPRGADRSLLKIKEQTPRPPAVVVPTNPNISTVPTPKRKKNGAPARQVQTIERELCDHFARIFVDVFHDRRFVKGCREQSKSYYARSMMKVRRTGTIYRTDRLHSSSYVIWYCAVSDGLDVAIASIWPKPRLKTVSIQLPVEPIELEAFLGKDSRIYKALKPLPIKHGQFKSVCHRLTKEGIGIAVEAMRKLYEADLFILPT